jgi:hypothetical protein
MIRGALRRFVLVVAGAVVLTTVGGVLTGLLIGADLERSLVVGFYLMGCFLMVCGFFVGNRGPARVKSEAAGASVVPFLTYGSRRLRWASLDEQHDTINNSALFITIGIVLVLIGVLLDTRHSLV